MTKTILVGAAHRQVVGQHRGPVSAPVLSAFGSPRSARMDFACWGSFGNSRVGGRRAEVQPLPRTPAPRPCT